MSTPTARSNFSKFRARRLQNPAVRAAYEDARTRSGLIDALVRRRRLLGLTQTDVARKMGVGQPTVSGFENEGSDPKLSTLQRYARSVNAALWVEVVPEGGRAGFYLGDMDVAVSAVHSAATERAELWTRGASPYLQAVRQPIPA